MTTRPDDAVPSTDSHRALVVVAAGSGTRLGRGVPKAAVTLRGRTILNHALDSVTADLGLDLVVLVLPPDPQTRGELMPAAADVAAAAGAEVIVVTGGAARTASAAAGVAAVSDHARLNGWDPAAVHVLIHDAARPLAPTEVFDRVLTALDSSTQAVIPAVAVTDTIKRVDTDDVVATLPRSELRAVQTPQGFTLALLQRAVEYLDQHPQQAETLTDEAMIVEHLGLPVRTVPGDPMAMKITTASDLVAAEALVAAESGVEASCTCQSCRNSAESGPSSAHFGTLSADAGDTLGPNTLSPDARGAKEPEAQTQPRTATAHHRPAAQIPRVGIGQDIHAFAPQHEPTDLWLAGLHWPGEQGLSGHSDGDAVAHACCDALFSAAGLGDLGVHFGTDRPELAGASGVRLLSEAAEIVRRAGFTIGSIAVQFIGSRPKFAPRREEAQQVLTDAAGAPVAVSATTSDRLGFTGRGEGISATATAVLISAD